MSDPSITSETITDIPYFLTNYLTPSLPYTLILARRCQFHIQHFSSSPNAELRVFTHSSHWLAAHIDLSVPGQTQIWLYASWEPQYAIVPNPSQSLLESPDLKIYQSLFNTLFTHIQIHHIPKLSKSPPEQWLRLKQQGKLVSEPFSRSQILFGTVAECLWPFLYGYSRVENPVGRDDKGYLKYIISSRGSDVDTTDVEITLPDSLVFQRMSDQHLQTIIDRTVIPRTLETVRQLVNIGIFEGQKPVAWGLLGKDGSVSSLHVEEEWRGQGLAGLVARKLIEEQWKLFEDLGIGGLASADVSEENLASRRVLEKLGGKVMWVVAWVALELGEL